MQSNTVDGAAVDRSPAAALFDGDAKRPEWMLLQPTEKSRNNASAVWVKHHAKFWTYKQRVKAMSASARFADTR